MADLYFDPEADATLTALEADKTRQDLADRVSETLDTLEREPDNPTVRRRRFQIGLWGIPVSGSGEDWIILWEPHPELADAIVVHHVGPASFA